MGYSYKCYSDTKDFMKKYVNAEEGAIIYGISKSRIIVVAREAGAVYKVGKSALINTQLFEEYLERFREPAKAYVHSTFLHIVLCWINRLMFALVVQMRRHAKETMPTTLLIGRTLNTSKN